LQRAHLRNHPNTIIEIDRCGQVHNRIGLWSRAIYRYHLLLFLPSSLLLELPDSGRNKRLSVEIDPLILTETEQQNGIAFHFIDIIYK
jgi:hypothetical protein